MFYYSRTVFEKYYQSSDGSLDTILRLRVSRDIVHFHYRSTTGEDSVDFVDNIPTRSWILYALQVSIFCCKKLADYNLET